MRRISKGPKDKPDIVLEDMQALLKSTQKKLKEKGLAPKHKKIYQNVMQSC